MSRFAFIASIVLVFSSATSVAASIDAHSDVVSLLASSHHLGDVKLAAKVVHEGGQVTDQAATDLLAQRLAIMTEQGVPDASVDTIAWVAKALGGTDNARYRDVIENTLWHDTNAKHIANHVSQALRNLPKNGDESFRPERGLWPYQLRERALAGRELAGVNPELLATVPEGASLQDIYNRIGAPETVRQHFGRPTIFDQSGRPHRLQLDYGQGGVINLRQAGNDWVATDVVPYRTDNDLAAALASLEADVYAEAARNMLDRQHFPEDLVLRLANTLDRQAEKRDIGDRQAFMALCDALAFSGDAAARNALVRAANGVGNPTIKSSIIDFFRERGYF